MSDIMTNWIHCSIVALVGASKSLIKVGTMTLLSILSGGFKGEVYSIRDGKKFLKAAKEATENKPFIVLKGGITEPGAKAASSHTGSIAKENDALFDNMLKQAGVIRARNLEESFDFAKAFNFLNLPVVTVRWTPKFGQLDKRGSRS
jgi:hypothetical protein